LSDLSQHLQDVIAGRYRIERALGLGGMATVFLAEDLQHHRQAAIKGLSPEVFAAVGSKRFLRAIETVPGSPLRTFCLCTTRGLRMACSNYVMPYVEGESLRQRVRRGAGARCRETRREDVEARHARP
jgi:eukaryotic-like serine/threonine-protein kinase